jgi:hypothetical protein
MLHQGGFRALEPAPANEKVANLVFLETFWKVKVQLAWAPRSEFPISLSLAAFDRVNANYFRDSHTLCDGKMVVVSVVKVRLAVQPRTYVPFVQKTLKYGTTQH